MKAHKEGRRNFVNMILGVGVLATITSILYPFYQYLVPPQAGEANVSQLKLPFKRADILAEAKRARYFKFGREMGIIFVNDSGGLSALSAMCTHLDCTVQNRPDQGIIWCACHNGKYAQDGSNISGPPPKPLKPFVVNEVGDDIFISRGELT